MQRFRCALSVIMWFLILSVTGAYGVLAASPQAGLWTNQNASSSSFHSVNAKVDNSSTFSWHGITLYKVTGNSFYSFVFGKSSTMPHSLQPGATYLASAYITTRGTSRMFFWKHYLKNGIAEGAGSSYADGTVRRYFWVFTADGAHSPDPVWFFSGSDTPFTVWIGGFQIQKVDAAASRDGVAVIGDSTTAGGSGMLDLARSQEWTRWSEALLSVPFYNRAIGGQTTEQMDQRWSKDISPLAKTCKYVIIQGGINDIGHGRALSDIESSVQDMYNKAVKDNMIPIIATCTPIGNDKEAIPGREQERQELNSWEKKTFSYVFDFASVVQNPSNPSQIKQLPGWAPPDGSAHYQDAAKEAIGKYVASWPHWQFMTP